MACVNHRCNSCGERWEDNFSGGECPKCGSNSVSSFFDEFEPDPDSDEQEEKE